MDAAYHNPWTWLRDVAPAITAPTQEDDVTEAERAALHAQIAEISGERDIYAGALDSANRVKAEIETDYRQAFKRVKRGRSARYLAVSDADVLAAVARAGQN